MDFDFRFAFEVAQSTTAYNAVLQRLPSMFVGQDDRLRLLIAAAADVACASLNKRGLHLPLWRKPEYMLDLEVAIGEGREAVGVANAGRRGTAREQRRVRWWWEVEHGALKRLKALAAVEERSGNVDEGWTQRRIGDALATVEERGTTAQGNGAVGDGVRGESRG
ncbi:hypothetical protein BS78_07G061200 [Paspalum vaginatum]|nr:hypothetical protein BS78_07G061200 [Paspalum vaginatum]